MGEGGQQDEQADLPIRLEFKGMGVWKGTGTREPKVTEGEWRNLTVLGRPWASGRQPRRQGWEPGGP